MNKRLIWFTELFLWSVLILALILGFTYAFATADEKNHSYYMFFNDVDGLSQGSPVRMMGYQIGYVRDVKVFDDNIFVSFLVTKKNVYIPLGSVARVEFYGLGGSKSLEISPPEEDGSVQKGEIIIAKNPYRISDYYNWGKEINTTLEVIASNTSGMLDAVVKGGFNKPFLVKSAQKINNVLQSFIKNEDESLNAVNKKLDSFNDKYDDIKENCKQDNREPIPLIKSKETTNDRSNIK